MSTAFFATGGLIVALCGVAAATDLRTGHIPNRLVVWGLGLAAAVPIIAALCSAPHLAVPAVLGQGLGRALAGLVLTAAVPFALFLMRALGGGDVKLFAAVGALGGPSLGLAIVSHAFFFAVPLALVIWIRQGRLRAALSTTGRLALSWAPDWIASRAARRSGLSGLAPSRSPRRVPRAALTRVKFAPMILLAALWVLVRAAMNTPA